MRVNQDAIIPYRGGLLRLKPLKRKSGTFWSMHWKITPEKFRTEMIKVWGGIVERGDIDREIEKVLLSTRNGRDPIRKSIKVEAEKRNTHAAWERAQAMVNFLLEVEFDPTPAQVEKKLSPVLNEFWEKHVMPTYGSGGPKPAWSKKTAVINIRKWRHISRTLGHKRMDEILPADLRIWTSHLLSTYAHSYAHSLWKMGRQVFNMAMKLDSEDQAFGSGTGHRLKGRNPFDMVKIGPPPREKRNTWSVDDLNKILNKGFEIDQAIFTLATLCIETGMRVSEATGVKWEDIKDGLIHIRRFICPMEGVKSVGKTRNSKRVVPISSTLESTLEWWREVKAPVKPYNSATILSDPNGFIFARKDGEHLRYGIARDRLARVLHQSGMREKNISFHEFRHSFITHAVKSNIDITWIQSVVGHSSLRTTLGYVDRVDDGQKMLDVYGGRTSAARGILDGKKSEGG